jgi:hypothetical protein
VLAENFAIGLISFAATTILVTRETKAMLIGEAAIKNAHLDIAFVLLARVAFLQRCS